MDEIIYNNIEIIKYKYINTDYNISFVNKIKNKLYISYMYYKYEHDYKVNCCSIIIINTDNYKITEKIIEYCEYSIIIDNYLYLIYNNNEECGEIYKYNLDEKDINLTFNKNNLINTNKYNLLIYKFCNFYGFRRKYGYDGYMYKYNDNIYIIYVYMDTLYIYNINNKNTFFKEINFTYQNLIYFHVGNKIFIFDSCEFNINIYDLKENKFIDDVFEIFDFPKHEDKFQRYHYCVKLSENICLFILESNEHIIFDFNEYKFISIDIHINDLKLLYNIQNVFDIGSNYYYIDDNSYIFKNKLYFISRRTINNITENNFTENNLITLKSSISDKHENIPKDILILRSRFFKDIFNLYDLNEENKKFINEHFENINIYYDYIFNGKITNIFKLFDICLYLHDIDIEYVAHYMIKYYFSEENKNNIIENKKENIYEYFIKLNDLNKHKYILFENYFRDISIDEHKNFINNCGLDLLKYVYFFNVLNKIE